MASSLRNSGKGHQKRPRQEAGTPPSPDAAGLLPSIRMLLEQQMERIDEKFSSLELNLNQQVKQLEASFSELKNSINFQTKETEELKETVKILEGEVKDKEKALQNEVDKLSMYVARENAVFMGIQEKQGEEVKMVLRDFFINNLKLSEEEVDNIEYQRVHRTAAKTTPRPIKARFLRYEDKERIMRNAKNLKGTNFFVRDDIPMRMRNARKAQIPVLIAARNAGKLAYFSRSEPDKLFVDKVLIPVTKQKKFMENMRREQTNEGQK